MKMKLWWCSNFFLRSVNGKSLQSIHFPLYLHSIYSLFTLTYVPHLGRRLPMCKRMNQRDRLSTFLPLLALKMKRSAANKFLPNRSRGGDREDDDQTRRRRRRVEGVDGCGEEWFDLFNVFSRSMPLGERKMSFVRLAHHLNLRHRLAPPDLGRSVGLFFVSPVDLAAVVCVRSLLLDSISVRFTLLSSSTPLPTSNVHFT